MSISGTPRIIFSTTWTNQVRFTSEKRIAPQFFRSKWRVWNRRIIGVDGKIRSSDCSFRVCGDGWITAHSSSSPPKPIRPLATGALSTCTFSRGRSRVRATIFAISAISMRKVLGSGNSAPQYVDKGGTHTRADDGLILSVFVQVDRPQSDPGASGFAVDQNSQFVGKDLQLRPASQIGLSLTCHNFDINDGHIARQFVRNGPSYRHRRESRNLHLE